MGLMESIKNLFGGGSDDAAQMPDTSAEQSTQPMAQDPVVPETSNDMMGEADNESMQDNGMSSENGQM